MHFMLHCEHYAPIRAKHTNIFSDAHAAGKDNNEVLRMVLNHEHQLDLACCIEEMFSHRATILEIKEVVREQEHGPGHIVVDVGAVKQGSTPPHVVVEGSRSQHYNLRGVKFKLPDGFFEVYD